MNSKLKIRDVINSNLCIGCGLCSIDPATNHMIYKKMYGCFIPYNKAILDNSIANKICPGKGYDIISLGENLFSGSSLNYDVDLGFYRLFMAARSTNGEILKNASSGGIMTSILIYLLAEKIVDKVSVTKFVCSNSGVSTKTFLTSNIDDILNAQGSKYCPVNIDSLIKELHLFDGKVAIVGTPCMIAGIKQIQQISPNYFRSEIVLTIGNFCGGFKSLHNIERLAKIHKVNYKNLKDFRFRGGGQPGSLRFVTNDDREESTPYPKYVGFTGFSKMLRCHLCVDATSELADIACGDAWIPEFQDDKYPWSIVICRSINASEVISDMLNKKNIIQKNITKEEVKLSQKFNLKSKKNRQMARCSLYKKLGYKIPFFDGGFYSQKTSIRLELTVFLKHKLKFYLEKLSIYDLIYSYKKK